MGEHVGTGDEPGAVFVGFLVVAGGNFAAPTVVAAGVDEAAVEAHGVGGSGRWLGA